MQMCSNGMLDSTRREVNHGSPWHASSPGRSSCPIGACLYLDYLMSPFCISKFLVFTQVVCRGPFWDPIWAMSSKLLYLFDFLQYSVHYHCHWKKGWEQFCPTELGSIFPLRLLKIPNPVNRPWLCCGFGEGHAAFSISPRGACRWFWVSPTSQGCCEALESLNEDEEGFLSSSYER